MAGSARWYSSYQNWTNSRGFARINLFCAFFAALLWQASESFGWLPLAVGLFPWALRLLARRFPFRRTPLDLPIALFVISAVVGVWAAYASGLALWKLWLLLAAILIYYAIVALEPSETWLVAYIWGIFCIFVAAYDLLTHDWIAEPAKVELIAQIGQRWMAIRPQLGIPYMHPNFVAGITAPTFPFVVALAVRAWKRRRLFSALFFSAASALILVVILLSSTRGIWIALAGTMGLLLLWILTHRAARRIAWDGRVLFVLVILAMLLPLAGALVLRQEVLVSMEGVLPGPSSSQSRFDQALALINLTGDFPYTGGGLDSYPGLYSYYIRFTPHYIWPHGHNAYLDVAMEQGIPGFLLLGWIMIGALWWLLRPPGSGPEPLMNAAALASLFIMAIHGLVSDNIYHTTMAIYLFVVPGVAVALSSDQRVPRRETMPQSHSQGMRGRSRRMAWLAAAGVALVILGVFFRNSLVSAWYSNRGAIVMAHVELARWGREAWDDQLDVADLAPAEELFKEALRYNPSNRTAHHRLGLIEMHRRDFPAAIHRLETAQQLDPDHWGISKALAYTYAWTGQYEQAAPLMRWNPDIEEELTELTAFWQGQDLEDLALHAEAMREFIVQWKTQNISSTNAP